MQLALEFMHRLVAEAKGWLNKARNVTQSRTALKKMREVLHSGLRLGSELPQVEELRQEIRRREWEDHARKVRIIHISIHAVRQTHPTASILRCLIIACLLARQ